MKTSGHFYRPLAIGAPDPIRELHLALERTIHFLPPHIEKMRAKAAQIAEQVDVLLGNLEDAIPVEAKETARAGRQQGSGTRSGLRYLNKEQGDITP